MIPKAYIDAWRSIAPWTESSQVEQDLVISRAVVEIFSNDFLKENLAFRGGTALHKLFLSPQARYSEDIDLVQLHSGPAKPMLEAIRDQLIFLGGKDDRQVKLNEHNCTVYYQFDTEVSPPLIMRVKIEINTREHFNVLGLQKETFSVDNPWYQGNAEVTTYQAEELLGTKLRALYQRKKGRDLFDLYYAFENLDLDIGKIIECFHAYMDQEENKAPTAREFELNLEEKMKDNEFVGDIMALLRPGIEYDQEEAYENISSKLIQKL
ncbi:nucleotidyl transferase AbiEii/AbiGii toxin family protein [Gracilimonas sp. BCB1]|uniref:nucleotidyl transferase AbiEii/AbiGii toxin family protein n=1 Tax=Gracilimonas sp. BCB1 TaxID=3152362 RepID=UPI0032D8C083